MKLYTLFPSAFLSYLYILKFYIIGIILYADVKVYHCQASTITCQVTVLSQPRKNIL